MKSFVIAVMAVQLLTLLALCIHDRRALRSLRWVARDRKSMKNAMNSISVILSELDALSRKLDELGKPAENGAILEGFDNLMGYSAETARGTNR